MAGYDDLLNTIKNSTTTQGTSDTGTVNQNIMSMGGRTAGEARMNAQLLGDDQSFSKSAQDAQASAYQTTAKAAADRIAAQTAPATQAATTETKTTGSGAAAGTMSQFSTAANTTPATNTSATMKPAVMPATQPVTYTQQPTAQAKQNPTTAQPTTNTPAPAPSTAKPSTAVQGSKRPSNYNQLVAAATGMGKDKSDPAVQAAMQQAQSQLLSAGFQADGTDPKTGSNPMANNASANTGVVGPRPATGNTSGGVNAGGYQQGGIQRASQPPAWSNYGQLMSNIMNGGVVQGAASNSVPAGYTSATTSTYKPVFAGGYTSPVASTSTQPTANMAPTSAAAPSGVPQISPDQYAALIRQIMGIR